MVFVFSGHVKFEDSSDEEPKVGLDDGDKETLVVDKIFTPTSSPQKSTNNPTADVYDFVDDERKTKHLQYII